MDGYKYISNQKCCQNIKTTDTEQWKQWPAASRSDCNEM